MQVSPALDYIAAVVWPAVAGFFLIGWGIFAKSFRRRGRSEPISNPGRMRFALIGIGSAILLLALSEFLNRR